MHSDGAKFNEFVDFDFSCNKPMPSAIEFKVMDYITKTITITALTQQQYSELVNLYLAYYDGSNESLFFNDLEEKDEVIILVYEHKIVGFTTFKTYSIKWNKSKIKVIYSGDTVVSREHWGQQALGFAWIVRMGEIKRQDPTIPFYWFLLVKGHRTYKYMPVFGKSFYPHWSVNRDDLKELAYYLAQRQFGEDFNSETGVVEFTQSRGHLKPDVSEANQEELSKDSVRFFMQRNPNYRLGHELVCLCEMEEHNMKPLTKRIFTKGRYERSLEQTK